MTLNKEYYTIYLFILGAIGLFILYRAYKKGFFFQLLDVISSFGIIFYAYNFCSVLAEKYPLYDKQKDVLGLVNGIIWFAISYFVLKIVYYVFEFVLKAIARLIFKNRALKFMNRLLGVVLGLLKVFIIYSIVCLMCLLPFVENGNDFVNHTPLVYIKDFLITNRKVVGIDV